MLIKNPTFTTSAVLPRQYPDLMVPEVALAGRSNVGKSSFINKLINRKALARTSSKPGKTQTLNFYNMDEKFFFVDVPGYGYAKVSKTDRAKWKTMVETYFSSRKMICLVLIIVDFRHAPSEDDIQMANFLAELDFPFRIVLTKTDKIPKGRHNKHYQMAKKAFQIPEDDAYYLFSSYTGYGKEAIWELIEEAIK
ncbi:ribosome biogenesis GTP-binding protein YihA/YsxC [Atopobacter phocae]|uniref:ribosome biogenesis GTP-binding protein YihA/YsxC n=1 Tax=Atopobacter phocae TaxID=136492 RepID=UPI00047137FB|nr:ribosome biogenesis GTP-binding protein YihA/YsxC [Atopobacter phocae]